MVQSAGNNEEATQMVALVGNMHRYNALESEKPLKPDVSQSM